MNSAVRELARLRERLDGYLEEAKNNEEILKRSQRRELMLLNAGNLPDLLDCMIARLKRDFRLARVTVVICDPDHEIRHLLVHGGQIDPISPDVLFVDALTGMTPHYAALTEPWIGRYSPSDHALVFPGGPALGSVAMLPLIRQGRLMGSVNFGSADRDRFSRSKATDFLAHLAVIASFALENSVNRARLTRSGYTDVLTGWHNRRYLQTRLHEELGRTQREGATLSCLMLDLDHFKAVNDGYGHLVGDIVLSEVVHRVEEQIRASDVASRYGGEEFVILLPNTEVELALQIAERVRAAVAAEPVALKDGRGVDITVSIGVAAVRPAEENRELKSLGEELLARADVALYSAKGSGRNRVSG